jgi:hypothetical protein
MDPFPFALKESERVTKKTTSKSNFRRVRRRGDRFEAVFRPSASGCAGGTATLTATLAIQAVQAHHCKALKPMWGHRLSTAKMRPPILNSATT